MPRIARLISTFKKDEVNHIFKSPDKKIKTEWFDILLAPKNQEFGRILVITSRKIGNSPKRNQLRRRLKSIFYEHKLFNLTFDCIVIAKKDAINLSFEELKNILISALK